MTALNEARSTAHRFARSDTLEYLARAGFLGYGAIHLLVAWLALQIAFGRDHDAGDQSGALRIVVSQPLGRFLLIAIAIGLVAMAVWQALEAAIGHRQERGASRVAERVASGFRAVIYLAIAAMAVKTVNGGQPKPSESQQSATASVLALPAGRFLVGLGGVVVFAVCLVLIWYGVTRRFKKNLHTARMSEGTRKATMVTGVAGYVAKGASYSIVGVLLVQAALTFDPGRSKGLDAALRILAGQPYGVLLLCAVALGFAAYGIYCFVQARFRKV